MKSHRQELTFNLPRRRGFVTITREVEAAVAVSGVRNGPVLVNASTASSTGSAASAF